MTLNPIVGCLNNCHYCYARKQAKRQKHRCKLCYEFIPHPHFERLKQLKSTQKPKKIFLDSMSDFWGKGVKQKWRDEVYKTIRNCPQHIFQILTKQPQNIRDMKKIPANVWVGVSISEFDDRWKIGMLITTGLKNIVFVSIEPTLDDNISTYVFLADWIIVGALTGKKNGFMPKEETIRKLINDCKRLQIPLFIKDNLKWHEKIQEFPLGKANGMKEWKKR